MANRKKLFVSLLADDKELSDVIGGTAASYQIETSGVVWNEEPGKPIWGEVAAMILKNGCDGWLIAGKAGDWQADASKRAHISLAALKAAALMGPSFQFFRMIVPDPQTLPQPLAASVAMDRAKLGPRLAAKLAVGGKAVGEAGYRLDVHPLPVGDGMVVELGPPAGVEWSGALFAMRGGGEITHHTVGIKGSPPERGVVEYAMKGLKLEIGGEEYVGWAVRNRLDEGRSYYLRIDGDVTDMAFGQLPEGDAADLFTLRLA